ncbi:MAG: zinc ribbon domain-containing protein [Solobacterium sp.]|nr:zinc ribbon domain-containing protein [Solobacterium sp.]
MFCMNCGKQLPDAARFCMACGTPVGQTAAPAVAERGMPAAPVSSAGPNAVMNRDALKIYLQDLRTLEFAGVVLGNKLKELEKEAAEKAVFKKVYDVYPFVFTYDGKNIKTLMGFFKNDYTDDYGKGIHINSYFFVPEPDAVYPGSYFVEGGYSFDADPVKKLVTNIGWHGIRSFTADAGIFTQRYETQLYYESPADRSGWVRIKSYSPGLYDDEFALFETIEYYLRPDSQNTYMGRQDARKQFFRDYEDFRTCCAAGYENNQKEAARLNAMIEQVRAGIERQKKLLEDAYSLNIIPSQFRNVYAIHYIHDFMTTSSESLSNTLMHYNLDSIKQKLDSIMEQQSRIVMQNAYQIAQNEIQIAQNRDMLRRLAAVENNTELAAEYGRISSINTDTMVWLQALDILFK